MNYKRHIIEKAMLNLPGQLSFHRDDHIKIQLLKEGIEEKLKHRFENSKRRKDPTSALKATREQRKRRVISLFQSPFTFFFQQPLIYIIILI